MSNWSIIAIISHLAGACAAATVAIWLAGRRAKLGQAGFAILMAMAFSASWGMAAAATNTDSAGSALAESIRNLAWLAVVWRLFGTDGRDALVKPIRPMMVVLACIESINAVLLIAQHHPLTLGLAEQSVFSVITGFRLMLVIGGLVLLHNLYSGASSHARHALRWPSLAIAVLWLFDLNLYTVAYLDMAWPEELAAMRGISLLVASLLLIPAVTRRRDELQFSPSRALAFRFAALAGIGVYFAGMVIVARSLEIFGGEYAKLLQFGVLIAASSLALLTLPSRRLRGWLKVVLVKNLFRHRYDYRTEWQRFAQTIGQNADAAMPLEQRAVQALAQITDSTGGLLLGPGEHGELIHAGNWQWQSPDVPACALDADAVKFFETSGFVVELDDLRAGKSQQGEGRFVPQWMLDEPKAWAIVPLLHYERLVGLVVLARPPHGRKLDWEDFDLLRVVGQQLATTLAESASQRALIEAGRFDEFNRRIAFVMHDIKNLASQLGLLARNAELHAENPDFRADMLVTLRNSADKLNALIARLSRYRPGSGETITAFDLGEAVHTVAGHFGADSKVHITECDGGIVLANREALEQALIHLVQNAVDASVRGTPVFVNQSGDGLNLRIEVVDAGEGMSPEFIRSRLFKPFVSSKQGGFGIGAFEARELIRAMNGRLDVESREALGTRFIIRLPRASTADLISNYEKNNRKVA